MRLSRSSIPLRLILALLLLVGATVALLRSQPAREVMWQATGEEDLWEGFKGSVALAGIELTGPDLDLSPDTPMEHTGQNPYGVNTFLQLEPDPEVVRRSLALMRDAGIGWARQHFPWEDIEIHARGDFEDRRNEPARSAWDKYDQIVKMATDHNVQLMVRLDDPPSWAFADPHPDDPQKGPPDNLEDYGNFVAAVVGRYCGQVRYYQIWNEPNIFPEWGGAPDAPVDVEPAGYAALLKVAAKAAREACDDVVIVSAALAPTTEPGGRNMHDIRYLEGLYEAGWQDDFDILAAQAFGLWTGPTDRRVSEDRTNFSRPMLIRDLMVRMGDAHKPVWISEMGWDSPPEDMDAPYGRVSEEKRAEYTRLAYERIQSEWPWVGTAFLWFLRRPTEEWHSRPEGYFRIAEPDFTLTETYEAMKEMGTGEATLHRGHQPPDHYGLVYSGPWRDQPREGVMEQRVGSETAELQFGFKGTSFEIHLLPPPQPMTLDEASVDEASVDDGDGAADADASSDTASDDEDPSLSGPDSAAPKIYMVLDGAPIELEPTTRGDRFVAGRTGLPNDEHFVILRVEGGEAWISEVVIEATEPASPLAPVWKLLLLDLILLLLIGVWFLRGRRGRRGG